jgi:hypothetical protein
MVEIQVRVELEEQVMLEEGVEDVGLVKQVVYLNYQELVGLEVF